MFLLCEDFLDYPRHPNCFSLRNKWKNEFLKKKKQIRKKLVKFRRIKKQQNFWIGCTGKAVLTLRGFVLHWLPQMVMSHFSPFHLWGMGGVSWSYRPDGIRLGFRDRNTWVPTLSSPFTSCEFKASYFTFLNFSFLIWTVGRKTEKSTSLGCC